MNVKRLNYLFILVVIFTIQTHYVLWLDDSSDLQDIQCDEKIAEIPTSFDAPTTQNESLILYIIIISAPHNDINRKAIRETWGEKVSKYDSIKYVFAIGNKNVSHSDMDLVYNEKEKYGDIWILHGVEEVYSLLSRKVLKALTWGGKYTDARYYLKTDDDCYVVVDRLHQLLTESVKPTERMYLGRFYHLSKPKKEGKWAESGWFLCEHYFDYATGAGYILTRDIVRYLSHNSDRLMHYNNEDTSLASWIAPLKLIAIHDERIILRGNNCQKTNWLRHCVTAAALRKTHSMWMKRGKFC